MKKSFILLLTFTLILNGCQQFVDKQVEKSFTENCIPPIVDFSYPVNQEFNVTAKPIFSPKSPWEIDRALPQYPDGFSGQYDIMFTRQTANNTNEIWIKSYLSSINQQVNLGKNIVSILIYHFNDKSWDQIPLPDPATEALQTVDRLYLSKNGNVYGINLSSSNTIFSKFEEREKKFKVLESSDKIPVGSTFFDKSRNIFWIFEPYKSIYSFNPVTLQLKKYTDIPNVDITFEKGVAFSSDGSIYLLNDGGREILQKSDLEILRFSPEKDIVEIINNPLLDQTPFFSLFIDHSGNLWLDDHAWMGPNGIWYQVIRSPVFITDRMPDSGNNYLWTFPEITFESSDGLLWFQSANGMTRLNIQNGEWCWFTTYKSNIVEDADHNLWMIADGKLYKNSLGEK